MPNTLIYTACFGDHDTPSPIEGTGVECHCFTDRADLNVPGWIMHRRRPRFLQPRMDAKWYKLSATHLFPNMDYTIWLDASIVVRNGPALVETLLPRLRNGLAFFEHPEGQRTLEDEARFSLTMGKYTGEPLLEQVAHYRAVGLPMNVPLLAGGCIVRAERVLHLPRKRREFGGGFRIDSIRECVAQ